jgi:hypothetical protein
MREGAHGPIGDGPLAKVQIGCRAGGLLQVEGDGPGVSVGARRIGQGIGDDEMQPQPLALRERLVGDVAQDVAAEGPHAGLRKIADEELLPRRLFQQRGVGIDHHRQLRLVEASAREDRRAPDEVPPAG